MCHPHPRAGAGSESALTPSDSFPTVIVEQDNTSSDFNPAMQQVEYQSLEKWFPYKKGFRLSQLNQLIPTWRVDIKFMMKENNCQMVTWLKGPLCHPSM